MNLIQSLLLGLVQGLTEFLPVSSSGHLVLLQVLAGIREPSMTFEILVHFGTLIAVLLVFSDEILAMIRRPLSRLTLSVLVGSAVTALIGLAFKDTFVSFFATGKTLGVGFIFTGLTLLAGEKLIRGRKSITGVTFSDAAFIGLMQGLAILPAVSRSGLTIVGGLFCGLDRKAAARFSFLLSAPVILGTNLLEIKDILTGPNPLDIPWLVLLTGTVAAALSGYLAIRLMLRLIERSSLRWFAYYVFTLGGLVILDQLFFQRFFPPLF